MIEKFPLTSRSALATILIFFRIPERMKSIPILRGHPRGTEILDTEVVSNWVVTDLYSPIFPICIFAGVPRILNRFPLEAIDKITVLVRYVLLALLQIY